MCLFGGVGTNAWSQVGINTESPRATLDVMALPDVSSAIDGIIAPQLSGSKLQSKNSLYTAAQEGVIVYAQSASPGAGNTSDKTRNITAPGYYYFNGTVWVPIVISASNGLTVDAATQNLKLGGSIIQPTTISNITAQNNLAFTGTGVNAINFNSNTLSIDATNKRVGIGSSSPLKTLDIEGTARLSQNIAANTPIILSANAKPVYVDQSNGSFYYSPNGFTTVSGGDRPGRNFLIKKLPITSTIARVRFVCYIHHSSEANNSDHHAYTYGDMTIIGMGSDEPVKFLDVNIKDYQGNPKTLITSNDTTISWSNYTQNNTILTLDQTTGEFRITNSVATLSYFFEILGGA